MFYFRLLLLFFWVIFASVLWTIINLLTFRSINRFHRSVHSVSQGALWCLGIGVDLQGMENLNSSEAYIVLANHQSMLDTCTFGMMAPPRSTVVGKRELAFIPFVGWWLWSAGVLFIDRKRRDRAKNTLDVAALAMIEKKAVIGVLPEGTRNLSGRGLLPFKKGAFHLAIQTQAPLVLAVCSPLADIANFKNKILRRGTLQLRILPPIPTAGLTEKDVDALMNQARLKMLETLESLQTIIS